MIDRTTLLQFVDLLIMSYPPRSAYDVRFRDQVSVVECPEKYAQAPWRRWERKIDAMAKKAK